MPGYGKITGSKEKHIADGHLKSNSSIIPIRILGVLELLGWGRHYSPVAHWYCANFNANNSRLLLHNYGSGYICSFFKARIQNASNVDYSFYAISSCGIS